MYRVVLLRLLSILCACCPAFAQKQDHVWAFGHHNGLDFNGGAPVFRQTSIESWEGAASVSDKDGNLLFYSNGNNVWDASGNVMQNGTGLLGNSPIYPDIPGSCSQGVAIVQFPDKKQRYYIFVLESVEAIVDFPFLPSNLRYSVVDMSLNGGLGAVVAAEKNVTIDTDISEQMCVVRGEGCYYWLIVHRRNAPEYKAFKIHATGVQPPVVSTGFYTNRLTGEMKVSPDETKLAFVTHPTADSQLLTGVPGAIELGSFDKTTGLVSNVRVFAEDNTEGMYGLSFSPDSKKLYCSSSPDKLIQYDISAYPNVVAIDNSKTIVASERFSGMRLGPDGKIYLMNITLDAPFFVARINNPNLAGLACNVVPDAMLVPPYGLFSGWIQTQGFGLGNSVVMLAGTDTISSLDSVPLCGGVPVTLTADETLDSLRWDNGSVNPERVVEEQGIYWVTGKTPCSISIDSFVVYDVMTTLWITVSDSLLCNGQPATLFAKPELAGSFMWNTGSTAPSIVVNQSGLYSVTATNDCGTFSDSIRIDFNDCSCRPFVPNVFSPNGDSKNDIFEPRIMCQIAGYSFSIYNRYGQRVFMTTDPRKGWDGTFQGARMDVGTYFYYLKLTSVYKESIEKKGDVILIR